MKYYIVENGNPSGPFEVEELIANGLRGGDLVWTEGFPDWVVASEVAEIAMALASATACAQDRNSELRKRLHIKDNSRIHISSRHPASLLGHKDNIGITANPSISNRRISSRRIANLTDFSHCQMPVSNLHIVSSRNLTSLPMDNRVGSSNSLSTFRLKAGWPNP